MAVSLGYKNVYRYPEGYPEWLQKNFPVSTVDLKIQKSAAASPRQLPVPAGLNLLIVLAGILLGGIALNLTPCIYPLIPITVSYFGGRSGDSRGMTTVHGMCYIFGLALTNSTLGVVAALTGGFLGSLLQNAIILVGIAAILMLFATSLFGFWELRLPAAFNTMASRSYSGYGGSLFMGLTLGIVAAPCIGPFVIGLFGWIAAIGKIWFGFTVFFILSIGMGLPLFILAVFSGSISQLPRSGEWLIWVKKLMGWILVGMAAYFIRPMLSELLSILLYSAIAVSAGIHLGWLEKSRVGSPAFGKFRQLVGICFLGFGFVIMGTYITRGPGVMWVSYNKTTLEQAKVEGKPLIIDFYAAWCAPCRELDVTTFHDSEVVALSDQFTMIKIDLTSEASQTHQALIDTYDIKGVPTIIFIDAQGVERRELRLVDYMSAENFIQRMRTLM
ncbi:MAG: thioredoxin family protein [Deltaproteobacteria bacterium]|nr:thioredoxin family protein [Deltaproteobacteria bacterium]